ncbi:MAG: thioredoxin family protein [Bacteroidales bacterium]|jgi:thiol-disulfide isomerase/thioredoxin|nr:thioredoxin family protein [Bacteroidales bacterium]
MRIFSGLFLIVFAATFVACSSPGGSKSPVPAEPALLVADETIETPQQERSKVNFHRPETWLVGYFKPDLLARPPHDEWYMPEYTAYEPKEEEIHRIQEANINGVSILIVLGTWCPDSHREVPRFIKMLDACGMNRIPVSFLGVDMNKFAPIGDYDKLEIKKVPTFIIYRNNIEAGRIIEYPVTSLERDLAEILLKKQ